LTQAFELTQDRIEILRPQVPLMDIFSSHPDAAPSDPKRVLESELTRTPAATAEAKNKAEEFKNKGNLLVGQQEIGSVYCDVGTVVTFFGVQLPDACVGSFDFQAHPNVRRLGYVNLFF
jgi:hypothetical protein